MKPGDKFLVMFEVQRLAEPNEVINDTNAGPNFKQNLWVAEAVGAANCKLVICSDGLVELPPIPTGLEGVNFKT